MRLAFIVLLYASGCRRHFDDLSDASIEADAVDAPLPPNRVFITSTQTPATFGAIAAGDAICASRAAAVGLPGHYLAWLSDATTDAIDRLAGARGWARMDGLPLADTAQDLASAAWYPVRFDESGAPVSELAQIITGTGVSGRASPDRCADYMASTGNVSVGSSDGVGPSFSEAYSAGCNSLYHLLCIGVDRAVPIAHPTATGRLAFVSSLGWSATGGIGAADAVCAMAAANANKTGTFRALLPTTTASAVSRFADGLPWVRPDGVPLTATASALLAGQLETGFAYDETGAPSNTIVVSGGGDVVTPAASTTNCTDWAGTGTLEIGTNTHAGKMFFSDSQTSCTGIFLPVYCLER